MRNRPHFGHLAEASFFCPGNRSFPNMAMTPMNTRNSMTILTITSEAKPGVVRPFLNRRQRIVCNTCAEPLQQAALAPVLGKAHVLTIKLFELGHDVSNTVHKAQFVSASAQPELTREQILVARKLGPPA